MRLGHGKADMARPYAQLKWCPVRSMRLFLAATARPISAVTALPSHSTCVTLPARQAAHLRGGVISHDEQQVCRRRQRRPIVPAAVHAVG